MNEIAEKGTEGGEKNANTELSATGMRSADSESETATMVQSEMRESHARPRLLEFRLIYIHLHP